MERLSFVWKVCRKKHKPN